MTIRKFLVPALLIIFIVFLDQWSKTYLIANLKNESGYYIEINEFFDIVYAWNYGASFGFMRDYFQYSNFTFLVLNSIIALVLIWLLAKSTDHINAIAFSMIIGGALGNIIDRIIRGAVFDFIYLHYGNFYFPAFNIADSFITIGAIIYFAHYYFPLKKNHASKNN